MSTPDGGGGWIRTTEAEKQQIYSLPPLATRELLHILFRAGLVGATGLEPAASWSQTKHSTKLSYAPSGQRFSDSFYSVSPKIDFVKSFFKFFIE